MLNLVIVKKGEGELPGLTDDEKPRMRGPKRASKIRKMFNLSKEDDVRKYVTTYSREKTDKNGKRHRKCPKIQRCARAGMVACACARVRVCRVLAACPGLCACLGGGERGGVIRGCPRLASCALCIMALRCPHPTRSLTRPLPPPPPPPALPLAPPPGPPRLVTPAVLQRKRTRVSQKKRQQEKVKAEQGEYHKLLVQRLKEQRERR